MANRGDATKTELSACFSLGLITLIYTLLDECHIHNYILPTSIHFGSFCIVIFRNNVHSFQSSYAHGTNNLKLHFKYLICYRFEEIFCSSTI